MGSDLRFEVIGASELGRLRPTWNEWSQRAGTPFAFPAFFDAWSVAFQRERTAFVVAGFGDRTLRFLLPLWHANGRPDEWSSLGTFRADYTECLTASDDPAIGEMFWRWLARRAPCRSAKIAMLPSDSLLGRTAPKPALGISDRAYQAAASLLRSGKARYSTTSVQAVHPFADQPHIRELATRIDSRETRRKLNVLRRDGEVSYTVLHGATSIAPWLQTLFDMHVSNFEGTGRASQFAAAQERAFYNALVTSRELDNIIYLDLLTVGSRPAAMHLGFQHRKRIYWYKPAFDLQLAKGSPGRVLLAHLFARADREHVERVDLLKGDEPYKKEWASASRSTISTTLVERPLREIISTYVRRWA